MLTKDVTEELTAAIQSLVDQGKEPSVALVKARLSTPVPMPAIIMALKGWKNKQRIPKVEVANPTQTDAQRIEQLEQQVASLLLRIEKLENQ
ncbi:hypothetical protein QWZ04_06710 [Vibrio tapetis subsp. quintayensis]|uniref:hypothetical protein n=1 Tax=Vibrio tapetis TaxID=52443 RepID=UPI0025B60581|nr:hypothetical protein [Vibrio tapetis]MDN3680018.1 hypothetical protein [Vibrio tapetis subsp. quintayensis]